MNVKSFLYGMIAAFVLATPAFFLYEDFIVQGSVDIFFSGLLLFAGTAVGIFVSFLFYRYYFRNVLDFSKASMANIANDFVELAFAISRGKGENAEKIAKRFTSRMAAGVSNLVFLRVFFSIILSMLVLLGGALGTIVLVQQNHLIKEQSDRIGDQTNLMSVQTIAEKFAQTQVIESRIFRITGLLSNLEGIIKGFEKVGNYEVNADGRARGNNPEDNTQKIEYKIDVSDFLVNACQQGWDGHNLSAQAEEDCLSTDPNKIIKLIPDRLFEADTNSVGVLSILTWLNNVSRLHSEVDEVNEKENRRYLSNYILSAKEHCGIEPGKADKDAVLAKSARLVEVSSGRMLWLFRFGFPGAISRERELHQKELSDHASLFQFHLMTAENKLTDGRNLEVGTTRMTTSTLQRLYKYLLTTAVEIKNQCEQRKQALIHMGEILNPLKDVKQE